MPVYGTLSTHKTRAQVLDMLRESFRKWGVEIWDAPYDTKTRPRAAVVWFNLNGERKELSCDMVGNHAANLLGIAMTVDSLRLASQRGILEQYRQFFQALPAPEGDANPWAVLGLMENADLDLAKAAYRALAKKAHPDAGGSTAQMARLNQALAQVRERLSQ